MQFRCIYVAYGGNGHSPDIRRYTDNKQQTALGPQSGPYVLVFTLASTTGPKIEVLIALICMADKWRIRSENSTAQPPIRYLRASPLGETCPTYTYSEESY
jgi:hypothetical protein